VSALPTGTVTFLFTDIEGSTRLLHELGEAYVETLAEHRRVLRHAFASHGGVEVDTQGDAFFVAFERASDAVAAAADAQAGLANGQVRVRMGLHTGEPHAGDEGYVGIDVHRAARVMSAGHGGQVLLSQPTRDLLPDGLELLDLGEHRLKDLSAPQRLFQLGMGDFPRLKTLHQTNLPVQPTAFVGRGAELEEVVGLLRELRLVTLTGPGGSGKTRLALHAAAELVEEFPHGVWWVSLAALRDAELVESTIAQVVGVKDGLADHLRGQRALLLLDNFEQVAAAAPAIAALVSTAPEVHVLATSRERLGLAAEQEYSVPALAPPDAAELFTTRARQLKVGFKPDTAVEEICRRLDGLPLAVELAAARVKVLSPVQICERLGHSLDLLTAGSRDAPERQRTLRATIEWSYELLDERERELFTRLAVFAGSFDLGAAEGVAEADLDPLAALVDKSLLRQTEEGRFFMLETIREFALERLGENDEADSLRRLHAEWFLTLAEQAEPEIRKAPGWLNRLEQEHDNCRAALSWLLGAAEVELAVRLAGALLYFWWAHGHVAEGRRWVDEGLARDEPIAEAVRAKALDGASFFALLQGDLRRAKVCAEESLELWKVLENDDGISRALNELAMVAADEQDFAGAKALYVEGRRIGSGGVGQGAVMLTVNLAEIALLEGDYDQAAALCEEALAEARDLDYGLAAVQAQMGRGLADYRRNRYSEARADFASALEAGLEFGFLESAASCLEGLAAVFAAVGKTRHALPLLGTAAESRRTRGVTASPLETDLRQGVLDRANSELGEEICAHLLEEGRVMRLEEAVKLALEPLD
jgi:predicted ATPase